MNNFSSFGLPAQLVENLSKLGITVPTPIQAAAIQPALEGKDILGTAQTGTGKTAAFGLPLIAKLMSDTETCALIMTPTRELAAQVLKALQSFLGHSETIRVALLVGGEPISKQFQQLNRNPRIIVGTPGRINDHLVRNTLKLGKTNYLVLDETDRMLDMGFSEQIEKIVRHLPAEKQTLLFSATLPKSIMSLVNQYLKDPVRITIGSTTAPVENIKQELIYVSEEEKYKRLVTELEGRVGSVIVFVKTKRGAEKLAENLRDSFQDAEALHGDLRQHKRERVINAFRKQKYRVLVATDIAARGLDIDHIRHVVNFDLPQCAEDYVHRIGRTGRAGLEGSAICLVSPKDRGKWNIINAFIKGEKEPQAQSRSRSFGGNRSGGSRFGGGDDRRRSFGGDRGGDRGFGRRPSFGDRGDRAEGSSRPSYVDRGDRAEGSSRPSFADRGDRAERTEGSSRPSFADRGNREFSSSRPPYAGRSDRAEGSSRPSYADRGDRTDRNEGSSRPFTGRGDRESSSGRFSDRGDRGNSSRPFTKKRDY